MTSFVAAPALTDCNTARYATESEFSLLRNCDS